MRVENDEEKKEEKKGRQSFCNIFKSDEAEATIARKDVVLSPKYFYMSQQKIEDIFWHIFRFFLCLSALVVLLCVCVYFIAIV